MGHKTTLGQSKDRTVHAFIGAGDLVYIETESRFEEGVRQHVEMTSEQWGSMLDDVTTVKARFAEVAERTEEQHRSMAAALMRAAGIPPTSWSVEAQMTAGSVEYSTIRVGLTEAKACEIARHEHFRTDNKTRYFPVWLFAGSANPDPRSLWSPKK